MAAQTEKEKFMKAATVYVDTREKENQHVISRLDEYGVKYEPRKLDFADYSFSIAGRDFCQSCVVERKANIDELYGNATEHRTDKNGNWIDVAARIQKELAAASQNGAQLVMLIENCKSAEFMKSYVVPDWKMKTVPDGQPARKEAEIGKVVYSRLKSWQAANRYNFRVEYVAHSENTAARIIEEFYYWYQNYKELVAARR